MKRTVLLTAGVLALGAGIWLSTRLVAQTAAPAQAPTTRIGVLNMGYVLKNYKKVEAYSKEMKGDYDRFDNAIKSKRTEIEARNKQGTDPAMTQPQREAIAKEITKLQRELEDLNADMKKYIGVKTDEQMVTIYKEIQAAASAYAAGHGYDLVLTHIDAVDEKDFYNPMNVMGKMQTRACMPLWYQKNMEISKDVVDALNAKYTSSASAAPAPAH